VSNDGEPEVPNGLNPEVYAVEDLSTLNEE